MKVYIVTNEDYDYFKIKGVFTDKKYAEAYAAKYGCGCVEEYEVDKEKIECDKHYIIHFFAALGKDMPLDLEYRYYSDKEYTHLRREGDCFYIWVSLDTYDSDKAKKIAQDMLAEYKANPYFVGL